MKTISGVNGALQLYAGPEPSTVLTRFLSALTTCWSGMQDGLRAARTYHALTMQGVRSDAAIEKVFDRHFRRRRH